MAQAKLLPFAKDTALCDGGWKKGMALKASSDGNLALTKVAAATDDVVAVALSDCADGEYGTVCYAGIIPLRVTNVDVTAGNALIIKADATWAEEASDAAAGVKRNAYALDNYDLTAAGITGAAATGLVTAVFFPNWHKGA